MYRLSCVRQGRTTKRNSRAAFGAAAAGKSIAHNRAILDHRPLRQRLSGRQNDRAKNSFSSIFQSVLCDVVGWQKDSTFFFSEI
jgi:hypothetical protein